MAAFKSVKSLFSAPQSSHTMQGSALSPIPWTEPLILRQKLTTLCRKENCEVKKKSERSTSTRRLSGKWRTERVKSCESVTALSEEFGIHRPLLYKWRGQMEAVESKDGPLATSPEREVRAEIRALKRVLADKALEVDSFRAPGRHSCLLCKLRRHGTGQLIGVRHPDR